MTSLEGKLEESLQVYSEAERAYIRLERNREDLASLYDRIGEIYLEIERPAPAFMALQQAMDISLALGWAPMIVEVGYKLVVAARLTNRPEKVECVLADIEQMLPRAFDIEPIRSQKMGLFWRLRCLVEQESGRYEKATESAKKALVYFEVSGAESDTLALVWYMLSENQLALENYPAALEAAQRAVDLFEQIGDAERIQKARELVKRSQ